MPSRFIDQSDAVEPVARLVEAAVAEAHLHLRLAGRRLVGLTVRRTPFAKRAMVTPRSATSRRSATWPGAPKTVWVQGLATGGL